MMTSAPRADALALGALILGAVCIGFAPIWVRWSEVGPVATAFFRLALSLPVLTLWALRDRDPRIPSDDRGFAPWVIAAGTCFAIDLAAWHLSIRLTTVANATLLANLAPLVVTLGAWFFLGERVPVRFVAALAVVLAGAWLLTGAHFLGNTRQFRGDLLGLTTAFFYGGYQLCVARLRRRHRPARVLWWSSVISTPLLGLIAWELGETLWPTTARGWLAVAGLALTAQVLGQGLITYGFSHLSAGFASLTLLVQPLVAALTAWWLFGERLTPAQMLGACVMVFGLHAARRSQAPAAPSVEPIAPAPPAPRGEAPR